LGLLTLVGVVPLAQRFISSGSSTSHKAVSAEQLPISFEVNQGQADSQVRFLAHGPGYSLFLTPQEALLALSTSGHGSSASSPDAADPSLLTPARPPTLVGMQFLNANPQPKLTGENSLPGIVNYLLGNDPAMWRTHIPTFAQVRYQSIYSGIDLLYHSNQGHLEYDFVVAPGSDPSQIHLRFTGVERLSLDSQGELLLHLPAAILPEGAPQVYQTVNGTRRQIASSYVLQGTQDVGFALGDYDTSKPLVIDPTVLFSTTLGGLANDYSTGLAVDRMGNTYITGSTSSSDFPTSNPLQSANAGSSDAFVAEVNAAGTALVYSTYLGGSGADWGNSIAVDGAGNAYVTGVTFSTNFPTHGPLQSTFGGGPSDAFVAEVNAAGTALVYATYLGGSGADWGTGIAVDSAGDAYITGGTGSSNFPTHTPLQAANAGTANAFVAKLNAAGNALVYSTYLGGGNYDYASGIAIDGSGNAYITGTTHSSNFPTHTPLQAANAGITDAFVAKLNPAGTALVYATYLGGSNTDMGNGIAVDSSGNAYITGSTTSSNFPTHTPLQAANAGITDAFVAKLNAAGTALVYSTYLGGNGTDRGTDIAVDSSGNAYITGSTTSSNFPSLIPLQAANAGGNDAFVAKLNAAGSALLYSDYLGGKSNDWGSGIACDGTGNIYVTGATASSDFPTSHPIQTYGGMEEGFLVKISPAQSLISPGAIALATAPGVSPGQQTLTLSNIGASALSWSANSLPAWASVSPSSGSVSGGHTQTLTLTFNTTSTTPQTYTTNLVLTTSDPNMPTLSVPITVVSATLSKTWYFAEGYTGSGFSEFLTLANPNPVQANVQVTYLLGSGAPILKTYQVAANARATIVVNQEVGPNQNVSMVVNSDQPIVAERPMYFTYTGLPGYSIPGGSDVLGATQLATSFDFGYLDTSAGHATFLTILNPNSSTLTATIQYFSAAGGAGTTVVHTVPANSRGTVAVNIEGLAPGSYSALVSLDQPGLVERPMYLKDSVTGYTGSADVVGVATPQTDWYFAEGYTNTTFSERYYLSNPNPSQSANATVTFFLSTGTTQTKTVTIPAGGQVVVDANALLGNNVNNSAHVSATLPILAERFMSFSFPGATTIPGATDVLGASTPSNLFYFAEGYTGSGFDEYLTIENPSSTQVATVSVTFYPDTGGAPTVKIYTIAPSSRFTLFTADVMPNASFSMQVVSNVPIVAERPMYFNFANSGQTGGTDVIGYQP
jgi:hypothetical protein